MDYMTNPGSFFITWLAVKLELLVK